MKMRCISLLLALALAVGFCMPAVAAAASTTAAVSVGSAVADGNYTLSYRNDFTVSTISHNYYYSESLFDHTATQYDHKLANVTLGMALASFNTIDSDKQYWVDGDVGRENDIRDAYKALGFGNVQFYNYDTSANTPDDYVGYSFAQKTIQYKGKTRTIFAVFARSGGYGCEWSSNMHAGSGAEHEGFVTSARDMYASLEKYVAAAKQKGDLGEVKFWLGGYSRGAAITNILAAKIGNSLDGASTSNIYAYTFATPVALSAGASSDLMQDFDNNHNADGTLKSTWSESNIFNIISSGDLVPRVLPADWGYYRNGNDRFLPATDVSSEVSALNKIVAAGGDSSIDFNSLATKEDTDELLKTLEDIFVDKKTYHEKYEKALMDMMQCAFTMSEGEVLRGEILDDEAIIHRLLTFKNLRSYPLMKLARNVRIASTMTNSVLERFGKNVPLRAKQLAAPLIAVGLCYEIDTQTLQLIAQYILSFAVTSYSTGSVANIGACHNPEVYYTMMQYYPASQHGMQASTHRETKTKASASSKKQ